MPGACLYIYMRDKGRYLLRCIDTFLVLNVNKESLFAPVLDGWILRIPSPDSVALSGNDFNFKQDLSQVLFLKSLNNNNNNNNVYVHTFIYQFLGSVGDLFLYI